MRFRHRALLGIILGVTFSFLSFASELHGQTVQIDDAQRQLVQAFAQVQRADLDGASPDQIAVLADNLNQALAFETNATKLYQKDPALSTDYATRSSSLANETSIMAQSLSSNVRRQSFFDEIGTYTIAVAAGFGFALLVLELPRLERTVRGMRLRRTRFE